MTNDQFTEISVNQYPETSRLITFVVIKTKKMEKNTSCTPLEIRSTEMSDLYEIN